jgi:L-amino acid N-acyltransferase YncA
MIRIATLEDLPEIVEIYNEAVATGFATADLSPVTLESRETWFLDHKAGHHPIYVWEQDGQVKGWCSLSPYRPGRMALRFTAEISYYVKKDSRRKGIASALLLHALKDCPRLGIKNLFAIVLEPNAASRQLLERQGFTLWGLLPRVADFEGAECGHLYYGMRVAE